MKKTVTAGLILITATLVSCGERGNRTDHQTRIIAHRGYWDTEGSAQNSLASLRKAAGAGCWGSEFDVHLTLDGVAVVNHDDDINGVSIQHNPYTAISGHILDNGETLPTLEDYLTEGARYPDLKLILEIKSAETPAHESRSVEVITQTVEKAGLTAQVEYIAFSYHICKEILARNPAATVAYLNGDKTPEELKKDGISGLDYHYLLARANPSLIEQAHKSGITTNFWTVNTEEDIRYLVSRKTDFITTDNPILAAEILRGAK